MTEMEAVREMGRVMMEAVNRQIESQREETNRQIQIQREERERNENTYKHLIEEKQRTHKEDTNTLTGQLEKMRIEKEQASRRQIQRMQTYDGTNIEFDEWQDKVEAKMVCNAMDYAGLLEALPTSLSGQAKRSFDSLNNQDKQTKDTFFQAMRKKLDPQAEKRNKELFIEAIRREGESVMAFVDRCRMYIRRSGGDTMEQFATEMLKQKVLDCLPFMDKKILNATMDSNETLDELIVKADALIGTETRLIGGVIDNQTGDTMEEVWGTEETGPIGMYGDTTENVWGTEETRPLGMCEATWVEGTWDNDDSDGRLQELMDDQNVMLPFQGYCWLCGQLGHRHKECHMQKQGEWYQENIEKNQGISHNLQELNDQSWQSLMMHSLEENQVDTDAVKGIALNTTSGEVQKEAITKAP